MKSNSSIFPLFAMAGTVLLAASSANATQYWDGTGGNANWNTAANWGGDVIPDWNTAINFGSLSSAAGTAFGNVTVPSQTTANNDLTAGTVIKGINFGNNGLANRTDAYTLQGNSIVFGLATNDTIGTTALSASSIVSSIEDVISLNIDLGSPGSAQNRQFQANANHYLKIDGVISGGANAVVLARVSGSKLTFTNANNSYLGATNIAEGFTGSAESVLEITSIANGGSNSSIGASSNAATNLQFNSGFNDTSLTTLRYIGSTNASTDRRFTLYGNISGTNSRIESSGAGTLSFTNTGAIASSHQKARNFYLGGTNTGNNTFALSLSDFTEVSTFTKQGVGKWIISGTHTYTGATTIEGGTLALAGTASIANSSAIQINSSAVLDVTGLTGNFTLGSAQSLSGNGTILATGKTVTVNGTVSAGNSPGVITQNGGTYQLGANGNMNMQIHNAAGAAGVGYDTISLINGGTLDLGVLSTLSTYDINLWSLSGIGPDVNGDAINFDNSQNYTWTLISTGSAISGFNSNLFTVNVGAINGTNGFTNALGGGSFSVGLGDSNTDLVLNFTAIPEPRAVLLGCLGVLFLVVRRRR